MANVAGSEVRLRPECESPDAGDGLFHFSSPLAEPSRLTSLSSHHILGAVDSSHSSGLSILHTQCPLLAVGPCRAAPLPGRPLLLPLPGELHSVRPRTPGLGAPPRASTAPILITLVITCLPSSGPKFLQEPRDTTARTGERTNDPLSTLFNALVCWPCKILVPT